MSGPALAVTLEPDQISLAAGGSTSVTVRLRNVSRQLHHVRVRVDGLPDGATYAPVPDSLLKLMPAARADVAVEVRLPESPPAAGRYVLAVVCRSEYAAAVSRAEELRLTVEPAPALTLELAPLLVRSTRRARFVATVTNTGNTPLRARVRGADAEGRMRLDVVPAEVGLAPHQAARVVLAASAPALWTGSERQHPVTVHAQAEGAAAEAKVTYAQRPRLPAGALRLVGGAAGLAVLAGGVAAAALALGRGDDEPGAPPAATGTASVEPSTAGSPEPTPTPTPTPTPSPTVLPTPTPTATDPGSSSSPGPSASAGTPPTRLSADFDDLAAGAVGGDFEGFRVSAAPDAEDETCGATSGLTAVERDGGVLLAPAAPTGGCTSVPLLVRFDEPVRAVTLEVADPEATYAVRTDDPFGRQTLATVVAPPGPFGVASTDAGVSSVVLRFGTGSAGELLGLAAISWEPVEED